MFDQLALPVCKLVFQCFYRPPFKHRLLVLKVQFDRVLFAGCITNGRSIVCTNFCCPTAHKGCRGIVFTHGVRMGGWAAVKILSGLYLSETVRCRKLIFGRDIS